MIYVNRDSFDSSFVCTQMFSFYFPNVPIDFHHFNVFILGLKKVKEERPDLNEVEEEYQDQKDHDVNEEKSVSDSIRTTDVKKPFSCSQCGNSFTRKTSLKDHMLIHTGKSLSAALSAERVLH